MKIRIDNIKISARVRQENSDIADIKDSIAKVGLLNPIIINEQNELLSGLRRLTACRELGYEKIEAILVRTGEDELKKLDIEYHENLGRLNLTEADRQNYEHLRHHILFPPKRRGILRFFKRFWQFITKLFSLSSKKDLF